MDPNSRATGDHGMVRMAWILPPSQVSLHFESFHSLILISLFIGEAHLVPFPLFHFGLNIASGMD